MKNRPRPAVPDRVKIEVAIRQLQNFYGRLELWMLRGSGTMREPLTETLPSWLGRLLGHLTIALNCKLSDLRLDHEPALRRRAYNPRIKKVAARYTPNANDPDAMEYRPHGAEFERSHHIKTNVRGDHGQFSDTVLIKRERRREKKATKKRTPKISGQRRPAHAKIRSRPFPPKGSRPLRWKR